MLFRQHSHNGRWLEWRALQSQTGQCPFGLFEHPSIEHLSQQANNIVNQDINGFVTCKSCDKNSSHLLDISGTRIEKDEENKCKNLITLAFRHIKYRGKTHRLVEYSSNKLLGLEIGTQRREHKRRSVYQQPEAGPAGKIHGCILSSNVATPQ